MTIDEARERVNAIEDDELRHLGLHTLCTPSTVSLDGDFHVEELEALVMVMRHEMASGIQPDTERPRGWSQDGIAMCIACGWLALWLVFGAIVG